MGSPIINFEPDFQIDFQLDFQPDQNEFENVTLPDGSIISKRKSETVEQARSRHIGRPDTSMYDTTPFWEKSRQELVNKVAMSPNIPESIKPNIAIMANQFLELPRTVTELFSQPENLAIPGILKRLFKSEPVVPPKKVPLALPPGRENVFIGGPPGGSGQVIRQGEILPELRPQAEARLTADPTTGISTGQPAAKFTDLGEVKESDRLANTFFTGHEQGGGTALTLPDRSNIPIPPTAGETRLGFDPVSGSDLEYPLNVVPEAVRPRRAQTVIRSLAGDVKEVPPGPKIEFQNEQPVKRTPTTLQNDLKGGTAAIQPGESWPPIFKKASKNTGVQLDEQIVNAVPPPLKEPVVKLVAEESQLPSPWKSIRTVLKELSPELWRREVRSVQLARQYDARWVPAFEGALQKLTKVEKENFGAFVEGSAPITSPTVQEAVNVWKQVESSIGDEAASRSLRLYKGKEHVPFQKNTENYWPRIPKERYNDKTLLETLIEKGMSRNEAKRVVNHYIQEGEIIIGPQHSRVGRTDVPYRMDADAGLQHIRAMSKRIAQHRELGPLDVEGKGAEGISDLIEGTKDPTLTLALMRRLIGREEKTNPKLGRILDWSRRYTAMTKLQNFTIPNMILGQPATIMRATRHPLASIKEVGKLFSERYRADLAKSGAWQNFNYAVVEELKGRDIYLIGAGETFNRGIAGAVGKAVAREAFRELKANPNSKKAIGELSELVLEDMGNLLRQPELTPAQLDMAAGRMAEVTQGLNVPGNLPHFASEPVRGPLSFANQLAWQLKKMGYQATKNVWDSIKANPAINIPVWLALSQIAGELTGDTKTFWRGLWKGDPETEIANRGNWWIEQSGISQSAIQQVADTSGVDPQIIARLLDNWTQAFFLGLPADLLMSTAYGPAGLADSLFGPTFGDMRKFVYNVSKGNMKGVLKDMIKMLPVPGSSGLADALMEDQ